MLSQTRRHFLKASPAVVLTAAFARPALALASASPVVAAAQAGLQRAGDRVVHRDVVAVADFREASAKPRLHLVDMASGGVTSLLVAHGRGSDPAHTGWLNKFSNEMGSDCTSEGRFLTGDYYAGQHGRSMRLIGLDPSNDNALRRGIVVHSAAYVGADFARAHGVLGRSEGCFAVSPADLPLLLQRLGPGRLLVSARL